MIVVSINRLESTVHDATEHSPHTILVLPPEDRLTLRLAERAVQDY